MIDGQTFAGWRWRCGRHQMVDCMWFDWHEWLAVTIELCLMYRWCFQITLSRGQWRRQCGGLCCYLPFRWWTPAFVFRIIDSLTCSRQNPRGFYFRHYFGRLFLDFWRSLFHFSFLLWSRLFLYFFSFFCFGCGFFHFSCSFLRFCLPRCTFGVFLDFNAYFTGSWMRMLNDCQRRSRCICRHRCDCDRRLG